jgi:hypothetical protein
MNMKLGWVGIAGVTLLVSGSVNAAPILFDFNAAPVEMNSATGSDPIETYMEGIYGSSITLAAGARNEDDRTEGMNNTYPYLGSTNGAIDRLGTCGTGPCATSNPDRFLINRWSNGFDRITITFDVVPITGIQFDWEIFPVTQSGQNADLTFRWIDINGVSNSLLIQALAGANKQLGDMGHSSFAFSTPVRTIEFIDWTDAPIGVDNLVITQTPAPGTLVLLGAGFAALAARRVARRRSKKPEGSSASSN